jgi:octaprenyl-diphosphate synthase
VEAESQSPESGTAASDVLSILSTISANHKVESLATTLSQLKRWMGSDLAEVEAGLATIEHRQTPVHDSARHLLGQKGKRLRPLCVALAARVGTGFGDAARELAIAVELVHSATLLHDDVIDLGDKRRGVDTARVIYGNAGSIYAGDWLLVDALRRIARVGIPGLLDKSLSVLHEILEAEALQLANRGNVRGTVADYFRIVEGKTASLFRWALFAGASAGGVSPEHCLLLESYGRNLGVAFQVIDDVLDLAGNPEVVGKSLFADLHEGKMTYPLLLAIERAPLLGEELAAACEQDALCLDPHLEKHLTAVLWESGVVEQCITLARLRSAEAIAALSPLPSSKARAALEQVALALVHREK